MTGENLDHGVSADAELRDVDGIGDDAVSVDGLLGQLSDMLKEAEGWSGINSAGAGLAKMRDLQRAAFKREANLFRDVFSTPDGAKLLSLFFDRTIRRPQLPEGIIGMTMDQLAPVLLARHAENEFVRAIVEAIAQADNRQPETQTF